jgi:preprotein translocase subunit SecA
MKFLQYLFDPNKKEIDFAKPLVEKINALEPEYSKLTDAQLSQKTAEFRKRLGTLKSNKYDLSTSPSREKSDKAKARIKSEKQKLIDILPEAFAAMQQAIIRTYSEKRKYADVQFIGGIVLSQGKIAEMKTGEGKTQTAWLPLYLFALLNKGAHIVTPNDYLARVGAEYAGHVFAKLGMSVGVINPREAFVFVPDDELEERKGKEIYKERMKHNLINPNDMRGWNLLKTEKKEAYSADVTYGINSEFGFDYLRDNMASSVDELVQGNLFYAIVDEVDSILVDEARTPLIIAGEPSSAAETYKRYAQVVKQLSEGDYEVDEKARSVVLTEEGHDKVEKLLGITNVYEDYSVAHHLENALKANVLFKRDDEYIIRDGEVLIVDEFTGRVLPGRRYSQGLHQAIEAKEAVSIQEETRTIATITYQNFFRLYDHLAGMTGTALTEAEEFHKIYGLDVVTIPTRLPVVRTDYPDVVYKDQQIKYRAIVDEIKEKYAVGQPVLVGTTSVEKSEYLSNLLQKQKVPHQVLNAKQHEKEAQVVQHAGEKGVITIATNMAGRGTDIVLGEGIKDIGGLHVIGTERHESRRIDNQLRGRAGRQGDSGSSKFFVALDDDLMRIHGGEMIANMMERLGVSDMPIEASMISNSIESAQKRVEGHNFDIRKRVVDYDDVLNQQREIIYGLRRKILNTFNKAKKGKVSIPTEVIDLKGLDDAEVKKLSSEIAEYSLRNSGTIPELLKGSNLAVNWRVWIVKKIFSYLNRILIAQLTDDGNLSSKEEKNVLNDLRYIFEEGLLETIVKKLGYKSLADFQEKFVAMNSFDDQQNLLRKLALYGYSYQVSVVGENDMQEIERIISVQGITNLWIDHLDTMDDLREGISLRSYGQLDPLVEYKKEGFRMFETLLQDIDDQIISRILKVKVVREQKAPTEVDEATAKKIAEKMMAASSAASQPASAPKSEEKDSAEPFTSTKKVGRNDPCPCGSGKKYKKCHGKGL